ncbi:MAG: nucleoside phosphorylase [Candidatus Promineofilum sp.]|nr:nucleoside phosphorylase [Promineifilum sp.]
MTITRLPSTGLPVGGVSSRVIVCGDPARADHIAQQLDGASLLSHKREYRAHGGTYHGTPVTVCSHGIGAPGAAIAFEELIVAGGRTIIRVGTCGGLQPDIQPGALIVATAAVQNTGYGRESVPDGYPAVADPALALALQRAATAGGHPVQAGIVLSRDGFYPGVAAAAHIDYRVMSQAHVLAVEMECAALFLVGSLREAKTAAILIADGNVLEQREAVESYQPDRQIVRATTDIAIICALEALCSPD